MSILLGQTTNLQCNAGSLKCCKPHEEIKCYHEIPACSNSTCASALRPPIICDFLLPPQIDIHCGCKDGYFYDSAGNCVTRQQCLNELSTCQLARK